MKLFELNDAGKLDQRRKMIDMTVRNKSKQFVFGYLVGRSVARLNYGGAEVFLYPNDDEMIDGYNEGFNDECRSSGKDPETVISIVDGSRRQEFCLTLDVVVEEDGREHYGTIEVLGQKTTDALVDAEVRPWTRVRITLVGEDDEVSFQTDWARIEVAGLRFVDEVLRLILRLDRPIRAFVKSALLQ